VLTLRIFDSALLNTQGLDNLVLHQRVAQTLRMLVTKPAGLVLFGGPHGSGKTILMYSVLKELQMQGASVITVEEPIEFDLDGVIQVPVSHEPGANDMAVSVGLASALAQNTQVLMMGDVGEPAVAQKLVRGALSGRMILAGMTTTQGVLVEAKETWEVPTRLIANSIAGMVTQRLVRRLCPNCKQTYTPDEATAKHFAKLNGTGELKKPAGCDQCYQTGFSGQVGVYEVIPFTPQIRELVARNAPKAMIDQQARQMGLMTLQDYAMWLVSQGHTTWEEIKRTDILELAQAGTIAEAPTTGTGPLVAPAG
jgi:type IV pilus assembly protein PilB